MFDHADARHQRRQTGVVAGASARASSSSRFSTCVPLRALHVDDRRVAGDGDRLLEGADAQIGVDRCAVKLVGSSRPSRLKVLKPVSVNTTT